VIESPNAVATTVHLSLDLVSQPGGVLCAQIRCDLPGVDTYLRDYVCNPQWPDELAAFYDDVRHDVRTWLHCWSLALDDLCHVQPQLF
jgi:hypothetical protein